MVLSSFFPYIEYAVNYNYIVSELCINKDKPEMNCKGKCHLSKQLEKTTQKQFPEKENNKARIVTINDFYPAISTNFSLIIKSPLVIKKKSIKDIFYKFHLNDSLFRPPPVS